MRNLSTGGTASDFQPPWLYIREMLSRRWHCRPGDIDPERDADEIGITLEILGLEGKYGR